ncbi:hypothetical protein VNO78_31697 [Psophocarpus tetragonolobus]|uniref:Uncharacterized protein n=1 Tax=Psophocarpus tetragonolobus TaxID=3891 RepID=A0AAN9RZG6_PSOTE
MKIPILISCLLLVMLLLVSSEVAANDFKEGELYNTLPCILVRLLERQMGEVMPDYLVVVASSRAVAMVVAASPVMALGAAAGLVEDSFLVAGLIQGFAALSAAAVLGTDSEVALRVAHFSEDKTHK